MAGHISHLAATASSISFSTTPCGSSIATGRSPAMVSRGRGGIGRFMKSCTFKPWDSVAANVAGFYFSRVSSLRDSSSNGYQKQDADAEISDEWGEKPGIVDEWGEKGDPGPEPGYPKAADSDPPLLDDEWEEREVGVQNGSIKPTVPAENDNKVGELKMLLADTTYGTQFGFQSSSEIRAEVSELVQQLEKLNPNAAPMDSSDLLDGTWVLLYTASSELLPLLALSSLPLVNVEKITQSINCSSLSIVNTITLSTPLSKLSFNASASFEVRSPSRIQVEFKESSLSPPEMKSAVALPENMNIFGQNVSLSPIQQSLGPIQDAVAGIARTISGLPPLKVPVSGNSPQSWLLITYLDEDLRICRGDGGLFILAKEGSSLL